MKRIICALFLLMFLCPNVPAAEHHGVDMDTITKIRDNFYLAVDDDKETTKLINFIKEKYNDNHHVYPPLIQAYYGSLVGLKGKHSGNLVSKYNYVVKAIEIMDEAVARQPGELESRFMRFAFYHQIPGIFGVRDRVAVDLEVVIETLEKLDCSFVCSDVQKDMVIYMLGTRELSPEQREKLKRIYYEFAKI